MIKALAQSRIYMIRSPIPTLKSNGFFCLFSFETISFSISKPPEYDLVNLTKSYTEINLIARKKKAAAYKI
ncbi:hypothetical protein BC30090_4878 [Bacillus cereus]|nr:hypothetical protein BC30090_4878 [Bacillus cereus]